MKNKIKKLTILLLTILTITGCAQTNTTKEEIITTTTKQTVKMILISVDKTIPVNQTRKITVKFSPSGTEEEVTLTSSDENIATINDGIITGLKPGYTTITATTTSGITDKIKVEVYKKIESLTLNKENITLYPGETFELKANITPKDATHQEIRLKSENENIATIENNIIKAENIGTTKITVSTIEGIKKECTVTVKEKPIKYSGKGDKIITNVNIPKGEYVAKITINSTRHYHVKFYYGENSYDYELLVNESGKKYKGTTYLKGGMIDAVKDGMFEINSEGSWTIEIEKLSGKAQFPIKGNGDTVTGLFEGTGKREIFNIKYNSSRHHAVKIYEYNGDYYDYDLLVNDSGKPYDGQVMAHTEIGKKYFFVVEGEGDWSIERVSY